MADIEEFRAYIRPWEYSDRDDLLHLEVEIVVNGVPKEFHKTLSKDDFWTNFELLWGFIGEEIQDTLRKQKDDKVRIKNPS